MAGFIKWMEEHFVPVAARIGGQRHLVAIRDGFVALMPFFSITFKINSCNIHIFNLYITAFFGGNF